VRLSKGDTLVMLGPREQLDRAEASARGPANET
jgi:K+/H+ antiporter YhaU regulatory subunit KhtT